MVEPIKNLGLLQPLEVPSSKFESFSMGFIVGLLKTQVGYSSIYVTVN